MKTRYYLADYEGYTAIEVARILGKSKQNLWGTGIYKKMIEEPGGHSYPFSKSIPVFTKQIVERWRLSLLRYQGWKAMHIVAFGYPRKDGIVNIPLRDTIDIPHAFDCICHQCGSFAIGNPLFTKDGAPRDPYDGDVERLQAEWPQRIWCSKCGFVPSVETHSPVFSIL